MTVQVFSDLSGETRGASDRYPFPMRPAGEIPRPTVTGEVGGIPAGIAQFGDGTNDVFYLRVTVNAGDDIAAASRLALGYPDVLIVNPGDALVIASDVAITRLDVVAIGDTTSGTLSAREIVTRAETQANFTLARNTWIFDSVDDVREVALMATERYSAGTAGAPIATANYVELTVVGRSYA
jgi:hypothetical protein